MNVESLGQLLRDQRESRELSLEQVHEATNITVPNLSALEDDRFDHFPNKVYARAFLRDYSNFLGLNSADLLTRYEQQWEKPAEPETLRRPRGSVWRTVGHFVLALVIVGGLSAAGYFIYTASERAAELPVPVAQPADIQESPTLPPPEPALEPQPVPEPEPEPEPEPQPVLPDTLQLEVAAFREVWIGVWADGEKAFWDFLPAGQTRSFQADTSIRIRAGMAGAVQVKLNGITQPPLAHPKAVGDRTFTLDDLTAPSEDASSATHSGETF